MARDLGPLLAAVTDEWLPAKVIADRAGMNRRAAGQQLASLARAGLVVAARLRRYEPLAYRLPPGNDFTVRKVPLSLSLSQIDWIRGMVENSLVFAAPAHIKAHEELLRTLDVLRAELNKEDDGAA